MSSQTFAPAIPCLNIGGRNFTDLKNLIILTAYGTGASTDKSTYRRNGASAGYQVTAGKTLKILAVRLQTMTYVANGILTLGYGDNDIGLAVNTTPTNAVFKTQDFIPIYAVGAVAEIALDLSIPAGKYPYCAQTALAIFQTSTLYCYEV